MKKRSMLLVFTLILALMTSLTATAQEATPEAVEPMTLTEIFASLPQARQADGGFVVGEPDAPITIIEFMDFACPHCQNYRPVIDQVVMDYVAAGAAKLEVRIFPTAGGPVTYYVGQLLECAEEQRAGTFWDAYELLYDYATSDRYDANTGRLLATEFDLSYSRLLRCADSAEQVETDIAFGESAGVSGTPGIRVRYDDGDAEMIILRGVAYERGGVPFEVLATVIDAANGIELTPEPTGELV